MNYLLFYQNLHLSIMKIINNQFSIIFLFSYKFNADTNDHGDDKQDTS